MGENNKNRSEINSYNIGLAWAKVQAVDGDYLSLQNQSIMHFSYI